MRQSSYFMKVCIDLYQVFQTGVFKVYCFKGNRRHYCKNALSIKCFCKKKHIGIRYKRYLQNIKMCVLLPHSQCLYQWLQYKCRIPSLLVMPALTSVSIVVILLESSVKQSSILFVLPFHEDHENNLRLFNFSEIPCLLKVAYYHRNYFLIIIRNFFTCNNKECLRV